MILKLLLAISAAAAMDARAKAMHKFRNEDGKIFVRIAENEWNPQLFYAFRREEEGQPIESFEDGQLVDFTGASEQKISEYFEWIKGYHDVDTERKPKFSGDELKEVELMMDFVQHKECPIALEKFKEGEVVLAYPVNSASEKFYAFNLKDFENHININFREGEFFNCVLTNNQRRKDEIGKYKLIASNEGKRTFAPNTKHTPSLPQTSKGRSPSPPPDSDNSSTADFKTSTFLGILLSLALLL
jgi:hypothetical protein